MFKIYDGREHFYQWDLNQKLIIEDETMTQVHFCNKTDDCALVCEIYSENGLRLVNVPNILFQSDWRIKVWGYCEDYTKHEATFKVCSRSKPSDYIYTETEVKNYEKYEERLTAIEETVKKGEGVGSIKMGADGTRAVGDYSLAGGYPHTANNTEHNTLAFGKASMAFGKGNATYGKQSVAFGCYSKTGAEDGIAWDRDGEPFENTDTPGEDLGKNSIAAGYNNLAFGESTTALGSTNKAMGKSSTAIGNTNTAYGYGNVALGVKNIIGNNAPTEKSTTSKFYYGHGGSGAQDSQANSTVAIGRENKVADTQAIAIGTGNTSYGEGSIEIGRTNIINENGDGAITLGRNNVVNHQLGVTIGNGQRTYKEKQIVIGNGTSTGDDRADIILNGISRNLLCLSESDGAYTIDSTYHAFTYPIADVRYHNYGTNARGPVFVADMTKSHEIPYLFKGQEIVIKINGYPYISKINEVWPVYATGSFTQNDIFGNTGKEEIVGAAFRVADGQEFGILYQGLNKLGDIETLKSSITFETKQSSLNLSTTKAAPRGKTNNAVIFGKYPKVTSSTLFAIGNAHNDSTGNEHNAIEVKANGDLFVSGGVVLASPNGKLFRICVNNDGSLYTVAIG